MCCNCEPQHKTMFLSGVTKKHEPGGRDSSPVSKSAMVLADRCLQGDRSRQPAASQGRL